MMGCYRFHWDTVAQLGVAKKSINGLDDGLISSVVDVEMEDMAGRSGRVLVSVDVSPSEGIDRLLWVSNQPKVAVAMEGSPQYFPLQGISVLKLVNHDEFKPVSKCCAS